MIIVTGCAGFIGYHLCKNLLAQKHKIIGIDSVNEYYDPELKKSRLAQLLSTPDFSFHKIDICDFESMEKIFESSNPEIVCHLAAQAGVRYSITHPFAYQKSNNEGFLNILELSRRYKVKNFVYASSSSVYGKNSKLPFSEDDPVDQHLSLCCYQKIK
jgi:UDP-glucuronate 4-epimerase